MTGHIQACWREYQKHLPDEQKLRCESKEHRKAFLAGIAAVLGSIRAGISVEKLETELLQDAVAELYRR